MDSSAVAVANPASALAILVDPHWARSVAAAVAQRMPGLEVVTDLDTIDPSSVAYLATWNPPPGTFSKLRHLQLVCSSGAGAEKLIEAEDLPASIPIVRTVDPATNAGVAQYVTYMLLRQFRGFARYEVQQRERCWQRHPVPAAGGTTVGILGLGSLGRDVARVALALGFRVAGWSRSPRDVSGVECHVGEAGLSACLRRSDCLVCVLPQTPQTLGLLDRRALEQLPTHAYVINVARGGLVVTADLLALIDAGHLSGAALDVHVREPLPSDDPLWTHPRVTVTPHIASHTTAQALAEQLCDNIERLRRGQALRNCVDRQRGY